MAFTKYSDFSFRYSLVHVEVDHDAGLIRRTYDGSLPTVSNHINPMNRTKEEIRDFFLNEVKWLETFRDSKFAPELVSYDLEKQQVVQKFYGDSCLISKRKPTIDQVLEMYQFFKDHNVNKINGSLSNMTFNGDQLIAFDFKYCTVRPGELERELYSYNKYLIKIDEQLPKLLTELLES